MVKRNVIENIVPIVVALKRKLAASKSVLMGNLMQFLRELMKDYKDEIQEILAEDRQLMAEIDFDLKRFEQQEKMDVRQSLAPRTDRSVPPPELVSSSRNAVPNEEQDEANTSASTVEDAPVASESPEKLAPDNEMEVETNQQVAEPVVATEPVADDVAEEEAQPAESTSQDAQKLFVEPLVSERTTLRTPAKGRRAKTRVISTPIRNVPVDNVTFHIADADLSAIPAPDTAPRKRKRR